MVHPRKVAKLNERNTSCPNVILHCRFTSEERRWNVTYVVTQDVKLSSGFGPPVPFDFDRPDVDAKDFLLTPLLLTAVVKQTSKPALFSTSRDDLIK